MLTTAGISPRVAQEAMRHSIVELTRRAYTDPKLLDIAGAIEALPTIKSNKTNAANNGLGEANSYRPLTPALTPDSVQGGFLSPFPTLLGGGQGKSLDTKKPQYFLEILGFLIVGVRGFEPPTLWSQTRCASQAALHPDLMTTPALAQRKLPLMDEFLLYAIVVR